MKEYYHQRAARLFCKHIPTDYIRSMRFWSVSAFEEEMRLQYNLHFQLDSKAEEMLYFPYWRNDRVVYVTHIIQDVIGFNELDELPRRKIQEVFGERIYALFYLKSSLITEEPLMLVELEPTAFFDLDLFYIEDLWKDFRNTLRFITNKDFSQWLIAGDYGLHNLPIYSSFPWAEDSRLHTKEDLPWEYYFVEPPLNLPLNVDLFFENNVYEETDQIFTDVEYLLHNYYLSNTFGDYIKVPPNFSAESVFEVLLQLNQNPAYDHLIFYDKRAEKDYTLADLIRKNIMSWHVGHEDAFSGPEDPDNVFSKEALYYWEQTRKILL